MGNSGDAEFELLQAVASDGDDIAAGTVPEGAGASVLLAIPVGDLNIMREGILSLTLDVTRRVVPRWCSTRPAQLQRPESGPDDDTPTTTVG